MINVEHEFSLTRQAELLSLSRASLYYTPVEVSNADLRLMKRIDELHLELPFAGSRMLRDPGPALLRAWASVVPIVG